jgi:hypothetical protein
VNTLALLYQMIVTFIWSEQIKGGNDRKSHPIGLRIANISSVV